VPSTTYIGKNSWKRVHQSNFLQYNTNIGPQVSMDLCPLAAFTKDLIFTVLFPKASSKPPNLSINSTTHYILA